MDVEQLTEVELNLGVQAVLGEIEDGILVEDGLDAAVAGLDATQLREDDFLLAADRDMKGRSTKERVRLPYSQAGVPSVCQHFPWNFSMVTMG